MPQLPDTQAPPAQAAAPAPEAKANGEVIYTEREVLPCWGPRALTYEKVKELLDLESEPEFTARMVAQNPKIKKDAAKFTDKVLAKHKVVVLCEDEDGNKLVAWKNAHNRPFDKEWAFRFRQEFLNGQWQCNGEAFIIGQRNVLSGIKRAVGFCLAVQAYRKDPKAWPLCKGEPRWETVVSRGFPETPELIRTLDNVKPRTDADTIFSVGEFDHLSLAGKRECSNMLGKATNFLWDRTGFGRKAPGQPKIYKTPSEDNAFRERHRKIYQAVKHVFEENAGRGISVMKLSPGLCAALLYLQGSGTSDAAAYRSVRPPREKGLDWSLWDKAKEFWTELAKAGDEKKKVRGSKLHEAVKSGLTGLTDPNDPDSNAARLSEKLIVLAKAWDLFRQGKQVRTDSLAIDWVTANGETTLDPDQIQAFGAIDLGPARIQGEADEDVDEATAEERRAEVAKEAIQAVQAAPTPEGERKQREELDKANAIKAENARLLKLKNEANKKGNGKNGNGKSAAKPKIKLKGGIGK